MREVVCELRARTPEETAVSIAAEIVPARWSGGGRPLTALDARFPQAVGMIATLGPGGSRV
jgi:xanthine/CO dehydrogenase XdhC/CoxF family maturation factor